MSEFFKKLFIKISTAWKENWKRVFKNFVLFYCSYFLLTAITCAIFKTNFFNTAFVYANVCFLIFIVKK